MTTSTPPLLRLRSGNGLARRTPRMTDEPGIRLGLGEASLVAVLLTGALLHVDHRITLVVVLLALAYAGARLGPLWGVGLGLSGWAMFTGFAANTLGTLTFARGDLVRLVLMVVCCAGGSLLLQGGAPA